MRYFKFIMLIIFFMLFSCSEHTHKYVDHKCECGNLEEFTVEIISDENKTTINKKYGSKISIDDVPYKDGYVFIGLYLEDELFSFDRIIDKDIVLIAKFEKIKEYNVVFKDYYDNIISVQTVASGEDALAPILENDEFFKFIGWDKEFNNVQSDLEVNCLFEPINEEFSISYVVDDDLWYYSSKEEFVFDFLNDFYDFIDPNMSRYSFIGYDNGFNGYWINYIGGSESNINKLIYNNDIEENNDDYFLNSKLYKEKWYKLGDYVRNNICKSNKRFGYKDVKYQYGALDFKRYILNDPDKYINSYGGEKIFYGFPDYELNLLNSYNYYEGIKLDMPLSNLFSGWYLDPLYNDGPYYNIDKLSVGNKVFYGKKLEYENYILSFNSDGAQLFSDVSVNYGDLIELPTPSKEGYTFKGWYIDNDLCDSEFVYLYKCSIELVARWHNNNGINYNDLIYDGEVITYAGTPESVKIPDMYIKGEDELRAIWVSSFIKSYTPSSDKETMINELNKVLYLLDYYNFNCVMFHLRTHNNAFYKTDLAPIKSEYGDFSEWEYLPWFIDECHKRGVEFHAWLNPYRIEGSGIKLDKTANDVSMQYSNYSKNPASNPDNILMTLTNDNSSQGAILNPAKDEVQDYIVDVCMEIVNKYDVDGIHFDDYFYARMGTGASILEQEDQDDFLYFIDNVDNSFRSDSREDKENWRRMNVDSLIYKLHIAFNKYYFQTGKKIVFGISPTGVYKSGDGSLEGGSKTISGGHYGYPLFSDTVKWVRNEWIDYIMPQLYVSFNTDNGGFADRAIWWNQVVEGTDVKLYAGIGIHKSIENGYTDSWKTEEEEMINQILYLNSLSNYDGVCLFSFTSLKTILSDSNNIANYAFVKLKEKYWKDKINCPKYKS